MGKGRDTTILLNHTTILPFELRVHQIPGQITVCESIGGETAPFQRSSAFSATIPRAVRWCQRNFSSFSRPYQFRVGVVQPSSASGLTRRRVKVVLGGDCGAEGEILTVVGKLMVVLDYSQFEVLILLCRLCSTR